MPAPSTTPAPGPSNPSSRSTAPRSPRSLLESELFGHEGVLTGPSGEARPFRSLATRRDAFFSTKMARSPSSSGRSCSGRSSRGRWRVGGHAGRPADGREGHGRRSLRYRAARGRRRVWRGSLLSPQRGDLDAPAASGARGRRGVAGRDVFSDTIAAALRASPAGPAARHVGSSAPCSVLFLARERARARKRSGAGAGPLSSRTLRAEELVPPQDEQGDGRGASSPFPCLSTCWCAPVRAMLELPGAPRARPHVHSAVSRPRCNAFSMVSRTRLVTFTTESWSHQPVCVSRVLLAPLSWRSRPTPIRRGRVSTVAETPGHRPN